MRDEIISFNSDNLLNNRKEIREIWFRLYDDNSNGRILFETSNKIREKTINEEIQEDANKLVEYTDVLSKELIENSLSLKNNKDYIAIPYVFMNFKNKQEAEKIIDCFKTLLNGRYLFSKNGEIYYHIHDIFLDENGDVFCKYSWLGCTTRSIGYGFEDVIKLREIISKQNYILCERYYIEKYFDLLNKVISLKKKVFQK